MQAAAKVRSKLVFRPTNLDSKTHQRLTRAIDRKHVKTSKTMMHIEVQDPERAKEEADREAERLMKEQEALKKRQNAAITSRAAWRERARAGGVQGVFRPRRGDGRGLSRGGRGGRGGRRRGGESGSRGASRRRRRIDDEAAFDDDEREADAAKPKRKRGRAIEESDSE